MTFSQTPVPLGGFEPPAPSSGTGTRRIIATAGDDAGMSLVEIIVMVVVMGVLGAVITGVFVNGMISQQQTAARNQATGNATVITETLADAVRNAVDVKVSSDGSRIDATLLLADATAEWFECRSWAIDGAGHLVYSSGATPRSASTVPWGALAQNVSGALNGSTKAFALTGDQLDIGLAFTPPSLSSTTESIMIRTSVTAQARHDEKKGAVPPC